MFFGFTGVCKGLHGIQGCTGVWKGLHGIQGFTGVWKGLHGIKGFTGVFKGIQEFTDSILRYIISTIREVPSVARFPTAGQGASRLRVRVSKNSNSKLKETLYFCQAAINFSMTNTTPANL